MGTSTTIYSHSIVHVRRPLEAVTVALLLFAVMIEALGIFATICAVVFSSFTTTISEFPPPFYPPASSFPEFKHLKALEFFLISVAFYPIHCWESLIKASFITVFAQGLLELQKMIMQR